MKLIDEIRILQEELDKMLIERNCSKKEILEFSQKLDNLIVRYYLENGDMDNK